MAHLDEGLDLALSGGALGHGEHPDGLDGTVHRFGRPARPAEDGAGRLHGVDGIGTAVPATRLAALAVDLDYLYALLSQEPRQPGPVGACPSIPTFATSPKPSSQASIAL